MQAEYSRRSPAVKRLMKEAQELKEPTEQYSAQPLEDNLFEWHFTVRGPPDSDFANGVYHGRITLPPEYPMKPPSIMLLTPTGRFEVGTKICLSISGHHPETWQPSWSIRTVLLAIIGFMPTKGEGAIGSLDYTPDERKVLAKRSQEWKCETCKTPNRCILPPVTSKSDAIQKEAAELASQIQFKKEEKSTSSTSPSSNPQSTTSPAAPANNQAPAPAPGLPGLNQALPPFPPNPFNFWNQQGGMGPFQPPFMPLPPNFVMPGFPPIPGQAPLGQTPVGQNPAGQAPIVPTNMNPHIQNPANQTTANRIQGVNTSPTTSNVSSPTVTSSATSSGSSSIQSQTSHVDTSSSGVRQRTGPTVRTNESAAHAPPQSARESPSVPRSTPPAPRPSQSIAGPVITMVIVSLVILVLLFRRIYNMYEYRFT